MEIIKILYQLVTKKQIDVIVDYLKQEQTIVCPTDTIYGLSALATSRKAINKIYKIKKRDKKKSLIILVNSWKMLKDYCLINPAQKKYLKSIWPGPVTVILISKSILLKGLRLEESVAVRMPKNELLLKILRRIKAPLVSTSLNISGQPFLTNLENLEKYFTKVRPDLMVDAGEIKNKPSRLVDLRDIENIRVLRK